MLDLILITIGLIGTASASYFDIKKGEIPDEIPISIAIWTTIFMALFQSDKIYQSLISFIIYLSIGITLFYVKKWGGGDAKLFASIGFLLGYFNPRIWFLYILYILALDIIVSISIYIIERKPTKIRFGLGFFIGFLYIIFEIFLF